MAVKNTPPRPDSDAIIGKAFRRSMAALLLVLAVVGLGAAFRAYLDAPGELGGREKVQGPRVPMEHSPSVESSPPAAAFTDITEWAGIDFAHVNGARGEKLLPETMGGGVAILDYDGDGHQDLLFVNGNHWPESGPKHGALPPTMAPTMALYRNDGAGRFTDVTARTGLAASFQGMGVAVGDFDNDGWVDIFFTAVGPNHLFRNERGRFREITDTAGVAGDPDAWSTGSAFLDYDNDGDLDLFVGNYVRWSPDIDRDIGFQLTGIGRAYGPPTTFAGTYPYLYRNEGGGRFTDVSGASGIRVDGIAIGGAAGAPMAKTLGAAPVDVDGDGYLDIFLANDTVRNFLFHNQGNGAFREVGVEWGVAFDRNGAATGAMGADAAYYRNDGDLGIAVGNFANEMTSLYVAQGEKDVPCDGPGRRQQRDIQFTDEAIGEGIGTASRLALTFGLFFFDYDLDGRLDLFQANGHLEQEINQVQSSQRYEQAPQLFWNCGPAGRRSFCPVQPRPSSDQEDGLAQRLVGRGAAFGDLDGDGDLDIVITQIGRPPVLLRNDRARGKETPDNHWLRVKLTGSGPVNRDAIGAWVEVTSGGVTQRRQVMPTRSYLSQVELPLTFGLGQAQTIERMRVFWPGSGWQVVDVTDMRADSLVTVTLQEGRSVQGACPSGNRQKAVR